MKTMAVTLAVGTALFVTGAAAQHEQHHEDQASPQTQTAETPKPGEKNMSASMMSRMPEMMLRQSQMDKIVDQLLKSLVAIEAEKDAAALKTELTEHGALLKELQLRSQDQSNMMEMMQHMMSGSMMGNSTAAPTNK